MHCDVHEVGGHCPIPVTVDVDCPAAKWHDESMATGSNALVAVKDASKAELSVTFLTNATVTIPAIGTAHTFDHMPEVEIFATPDGINDTSTTGKWTLTEVTNPVAYDQVQRCTATFTKWSGKKRTK